MPPLSACPPPPPISLCPHSYCPPPWPPSLYAPPLPPPTPHVPLFLHPSLSAPPPSSLCTPLSLSAPTLHPPALPTLPTFTKNKNKKNVFLVIIQISVFHCFKISRQIAYTNPRSGNPYRVLSDSDSNSQLILFHPHPRTLPPNISSSFPPYRERI